MNRDTSNTSSAESAELSKSYDPHAIEKPIYHAWEQGGYFAPSGKGPAYCIMLPPPNVTGVLHMGHAFNQTIMDALIRYHRMRGYNTLWQPGTDHAGIATQMVVERQLAGEGKSRHDLGREAFLERVWKWKEQSGGAISQQSRRMGASMDWSRERFTMDDGLSKAVAEVFVRLHDEGLIYRGTRLVNWDPVLHTAVSDLEVIAEEENGNLWHIRYPVVGTKDHLVVATTRPETLLGDSAVAVHPEDERYHHLIGKQVELPLTGRTIPIIADTYVDKEFGSGCVKITPAHDFNDYEVWTRHKDKDYFTSQPLGGLINIFTRDAKIKSDIFDEYTWGHRAPNERGHQLSDGDGFVGVAPFELIPTRYHKLDRYEARKKIVADLETEGLLQLVKDHKLMVPRGDRTNAVIEPYLTDQWYVRVAPLAKQAINAVENGRVKFIPETWDKTYYEWMNNIQDWCISRQIWWGHRIPAWYDAKGNIFVARDLEEAVAKARHKVLERYPSLRNALGSHSPASKEGLKILETWIEQNPRGVEAISKLEEATNLLQDNDVLDTWFSSALWPFSTLGWPDQTPELKTFYPTSVLVTGFDIIFFWVARMIMMGEKFAGAEPFKHVYIHGLIRDSHGQKMSKSKGNVLDPLDLIDGIDLEALVQKRTSGLMQPQMAKQIENATRKEFPKGIPAFGADALRFTFASLATQGRDIKFDLGRIEGYRNFCNKLWNAARYVLMNTEDKDCTAGELNAADRWIWSRLTHAISETEKAFAGYRFDIAAQAIYSFVWHEYCDWYLELSKVVLNDPNSTPAQLCGTRHTLVNVLETLLRLLHPLMPFITEEIWQRVAPLAGTSGKTVMLQHYPETADIHADSAVTEEMEWVKAVITAVRTIRSERDIAPGKPLPVILAEGSAREREWMKRHEPYFKLLARTESLVWTEAGALPESAMELVGKMKVLVPLGSLIDKNAELQRIAKEIEKYKKELEKAKAKLSNQDFIARAPAAVVAQEKGRVEEFERALAKLQAQQAQVAAM